MHLIMVLIVGALIGWIASLIVKGEGLGLLGDLLVGILGSWLGGFVFGRIGIHASTGLGELALSVVGAVVLLILLRAIFGTAGKKG